MNRGLCRSGVFALFGLTIASVSPCHGRSTAVDMMDVLIKGVTLDHKLKYCPSLIMLRQSFSS